MILASATVEYLGSQNWEVTVTDDGDPDKRHRVYTIHALSDKAAAFEGIECFVDEMEALEGTDVQLAQETADPQA